MAPPTHLVVGLGNPGAEYAGTRHNIGFMAVEAIAQHFHCTPWKKKFKGEIAASNDPPFLLLKPMTFMNLSGESTHEALQFYKLKPKDVIVFHDDLDLLQGQVKIKQAGGPGGHNGLKSLDAHIGIHYWRVRLGIGHPGAKGEVVTNYVLSSFAAADQKWLEPLLKTVAMDFDWMLQGQPADYLKSIRSLKDGSA
jgi:PTH1 family peptidyl-tRNA hydrolase